MKVIQISAGRERSIALTVDGSAYSWGNVKRIGATLPPGYPGELCTSNPTEIGHNRYAQPEPQLLNPAAPFATVSDGYADTLAADRNGLVLSCRPVLSQAKGAPHFAIAALPSAPTQLAVAESAAFALYADGSVWSWGMRANGQLGRVATSLTETPASLISLPPISTVAAGHGHVLALDRGGHVWAWGANAAGQLGVGDLKERPLPVKVALPARIKRIAAGDTHSLALDEAGQLWAWGANNFGQLGESAAANASARYAAFPVRIRADFKVARLDAGMFYSVATSTHGDVFAWGWNGLGQLGADGIAASAKPLRIANLTNVTKISAGQAHVLAVNDFGVSAWGDNRSSACGAMPTIAAQHKPARVAFA
jgi:alpha-tubulin suppressor-like RCC1 family protein